jgi:hypothetical protein
MSVPDDWELDLRVICLDVASTSSVDRGVEVELHVPEGSRTSTGPVLAQELPETELPSAVASSP